MSLSRSNLFSKIKYYIKMSQELQVSLLKSPDDWPKFQEKFTLTVDEIYRDILQFERENIDSFESRVYTLKKIFEKRYRHYFLYGSFIKWSLEKPYGYAGDFKIIDDIYQNKPCTTGFDRLWDNYFQELDISKATRQRKEDFKEIILDLIKSRGNQNIRIMNLGSGPARDIKELNDMDKNESFSKVIFDCYDFDIRAIDYARHLLNNASNVNFFQKNAIRLALKNDITKEIPHNYDLIYSTGLFDYLDERIAVRLLGNLRKLLGIEGVMAIANVRDKYSNYSSSWMEWVAEWNLIYRTENEFKKIFLDAGFSPENVKKISHTPQNNIMQYFISS